LSRHQPADEVGHRSALVGEDPQVALRPAQRERLGQHAHRLGLLAAGRQRQRPQCLDLDDAAGPALRDRQPVQPLQQPERIVWPVLREQQPRQHQIRPFTGVVRRVVRT
jgi:hypothetical protein